MASPPQTVRRSADGLTYQFRIRPRCHVPRRLAADGPGRRLFAHDLKAQGHPLITQSLRDFIERDRRRRYRPDRDFRPNRARDLPLFVAGLPIFSRGYYATRSFDQSTLDVPLGSGAYQVGRFEPGRYIEYQRVNDWWGADLPVSRGQYNFDVVRFEYYRDRDVGFEGFSAGNYLFREEFTSRFWATRYDFPAVKDGRIKRDEIPDDTPSGAQGWFINTRRAEIRRPAAARGAQQQFRFRVDQQDDHVWLVSAHRLGVPELRHDGAGRADAAELELLAPFRAELPAASSVRPIRRRSLTVRGRIARYCARPRSFSRMPAAGAERQARAAERDAADHRISDRRAGVRAASHAVYQKSRHPRHRCRPCASSTRCNIARAATASTSTSPSTASVFLPPRATRCARTFLRRPQPSRARITSPASPSPVVDALIDKIIAADLEPPW